MSRTADILSSAWRDVAWVSGRLTLSIEARRGVTPALVRSCAARLRRAADTLEELLG